MNEGCQKYKKKRKGGDIASQRNARKLKGV